MTIFAAWLRNLIGITGLFSSIYVLFMMLYAIQDELWALRIPGGIILATATILTILTHVREPD